METDTATPPDPSPWIPETDPTRLKVLGKLAEELNEGGAAVARCIIQGIDEAEPVTGKVNRAWLEDEIADVLANVDVAMDRLALDRARIALRADRKRAYIAKWLDGLTSPTPATHTPAPVFGDECKQAAQGEARSEVNPAPILPKGEG